MLVATDDPYAMTVRAQTVKAEQAFRAQAGDWVIVHGHTLGEPERTGLILEVLGTPGDERYRVRWDEQHESIFYPGSDAAIRRQPRS